MLWLKRFDKLSSFFPSRILGSSGTATEPRPIVLRPGGLGDMVFLTRAATDLGIDLRNILWVGERRNLQWIHYLGLDGIGYDVAPAFLQGICGSLRSNAVVNTEQGFGLSAVFASRLVARDGTLVGFDKNRRSDLHDRNLHYEESEHELSSFRRLFHLAELAPREPALPPGEAPMERSTLEGTPPANSQFGGSCVLAIAGTENPEKSLSVAAWQVLLDRALSHADSVVMVGVKSDRSFGASLGKRNNGGGRILNLIGELSFGDVVDVIRCARRLVSVDSGLVHVADFYGVPSDVVFPAGNPSKWRPLHPSSVVIQGGPAAALR